MDKQKRARGKRVTFNAICIVERLAGLINLYRGVICYLPEGQFVIGDKVHVTVSLQRRTKKGG
jgi:hypothetical protein